MKYRVTKTYGHNEGWSCAFRQWRADHSHCHFLHGYAISVELIFESENLDARNWVIDFGGLKSIKTWIKDLLDHKTLVAEDDPQLPLLQNMHDQGVIDMRIVPAVGCERFAQYIGTYVSNWLHEQNPTNDVRLVSVEVREHSGNSATWFS